MTIVYLPVATSAVQALLAKHNLRATGHTWPSTLSVPLALSACLNSIVHVRIHWLSDYPHYPLIGANYQCDYINWLFTNIDFIPCLWLAATVQFHGRMMSMPKLALRTTVTHHAHSGCLTLLEILEIYWKLAKSPGNVLAEFVCLLLYDAKFLYFTAYQ